MYLYYREIYFQKFLLMEYVNKTYGDYWCRQQRDLSKYKGPQNITYKQILKKK